MSYFNVDLLLIIVSYLSDLDLVNYIYTISNPKLTSNVKLSLHDMDQHKTQILSLLTDLKFLELDTVINIGNISHLTNLTFLSLYNCKSKNLEFITTLTNLTELSINTFREFIPKNINFSNLTNLEILELYDCELRDSDLESLIYLNKLQILDISENYLRNPSKYFKNLTNLKSIDLSFNKNSFDFDKTNNININNKMFEDLTKLTNLTELNLNEIHTIDDSGLSYLNMLPNLKILVLNQTSITDVGIKTLAYYPDRFTTLRLNLTYITDDSIPYFKLMTNLQFLDVRETNITSHGGDDLINFFQDINVKII